MLRPHNFEDILAKLPDAKQSGDNWIASCPLPGHKTPRGHLNLKDAGNKALVTCQGGKHSYEALCRALGFDSLTYLHSGEPQAAIGATYDYQDANGNLLYQVVRFEPKRFMQRRPDGNGNWLWNLKGVTPVLYRLPKVLEAVREGRTVYICEGEKDVNNLVKLGLTATTNSEGAGKWRAEYAEVFRGVSVVVLPDKDTPGRRHAIKIANSLHGIAKSVKIVELPDRGSHKVKDVSDWLAAGGTVAELGSLIAKASEYKPQSEGVSLVCIAEVEPEMVSWLWHPYIPMGKLTLLEGDPGVGKSWVSLAIATAVSLGKGLPGTEAVKPASVVLASAEDGLGDTIRPRLDALGADVSRIFAIDGALILDEEGFIRLEDYLERIYPTLVMIDPLVAYLGAGVDIHRANETREVMSRLARLAERFGTAIVAVRHLNKSGMSKAIYRGLGSIDFVAACRSVLLAGCDSENSQNRALVHIKSNLAPAGSAIGYELRDGGFYWTGESALSAAQILGVPRSELDEAMAFLKDMLAGGEVPAKDIYQAARGMGIAKKTLERAKAKLQAKSKKISGTWFWCLTSPTSSTSPNKKFDDVGDLENIEAKKEVVVEGFGDVDYETTIGMPIEKALEIWAREGKPVIHLGPGENCFDLEKLLKNPNIPKKHLAVIKAWLGRGRG